VRRYAVWALGGIKDRRAVDPLIAALRDEAVIVREYAARALGNIGDLRAVDPLTAAQNDKHYLGANARKAAKEALAKIQAAPPAERPAAATNQSP